ncbi:hypothetical protein IAG44_26920 [Streptomyces roseirectus]|uniref:Uncharacterized protein n=1 Tax=Streptomyces roseirectus TaxID=2768066 RepID=A0A7H0IIT4_9ACTN|nr:hypothetical protein [Streptomyces roseirectus]QNP72700.1 hypothetical protein IAG44_26920 [Streptomyces roseirectus]
MPDDDALLHAITGEPAPDTPELRAAHADIAVLRHQLALIAEELDAGPVAVPPRRRSCRGVLYGLAATGVLGLLGGTLTLLAGTGGAGDAGDADKSAASAVGGTAEEAADALTDPEYLACAATVVEGTVISVHPQGDATEVTLRVTRSYKPVPGPSDVTFAVDAVDAVDTEVVRGEALLVALGPDSASPDALVVGEPGVAAQRPSLVRALEESRETACPG